MNDNTRSQTSGEKKVWRPVSTSPIPTPDGMKDGIYFIAIEELQGAWIDGEWEEADSSETWTETTTDTYVDDEGFEHSTVTKKDFIKEIPRSRRYVLKRFTETGFAENALSGGFNGPRKYQN